MTRLNSENFSKFFLCLNISYLTLSYERTHLEVQKNADFFRIFLNFQDFFRNFPGFSYKTFLYSELQLRAKHHSIPQKILRRTVIMRSRGSTGEKLFYTENCPKMRFYAGENCVGSLKIK